VIHVYIAVYPVKDKNKRATVGPLPGVTQDIAGYKVMNAVEPMFL